MQFHPLLLFFSLGGCYLVFFSFFNLSSIIFLKVYSLVQSRDYGNVFLVLNLNAIELELYVTFDEFFFSPVETISK